MSAALLNLLTKVKKHWLTLFLVITGTLIIFNAPIDPDFGWHYKYGEYIFTNHKLLRENTFSYTFQDYKWANSYWAGQVIFYTLYHFTGAIFMSLSLSFILICLIVAILNSKELKANVVGKIVGFFVLTTYLESYLVTVRPMYFSTFFMLVLLYVLLFKKRFIKFLPVLFLLWANFHADFTLGLFILGVYYFFEFVNKLKRRTLNIKWFATGVVIFTSSTLATLINPYGVSLWTTLFKETPHFLQFLHISEMLPLNIVKYSSVTISAVFIISGLIMATAWVSKNKFKTWYVVCVTFFFLMSIKSVYFLRILAIFGLFSLSDFFSFVSEEVYKLVSIRKRLHLKIMGIFVLIIIFLTSFEALSLNVAAAADNKIFCQRGSYPCGAVEFIKNNPNLFTGNMFNSYNWGGFLIWQLPEHKTFIDGRMASWKENGTYLFEEYVDLGNNQEKQHKRFNDYKNKYNITFILGTRNSDLIKYLVSTGTWRIIYFDSNATVAMVGD